MTHTILLVEDDPVQRRMIATVLTKKLGFEVMQAAHGAEAMKRITASNLDDISAVLLDVEMPQMDGFDTLAAMRQQRPDLPVLMLTGNDDTASAVKAIKAGASDFIIKPPDPALLKLALTNAIRLSTLSRELARVKRDKDGILTLGGLVGHHRGLKQAVAVGRKAAASTAPVLLMGESGVGKELFARAIHGESKRSTAPFIAINCSAIPEHLVESTLFSPEKGAFRKAEHGTIFLDDVGHLPQEAQVRLLRLLQHKEIESASGGKPVKLQVRIIAASERELAREVAAGRFREDLYFRLNILPIRLPPLRERREDIVPLAEYFIERISLAEGLALRHLSAEAQHYLTHQSWPGNVRELENLIHRALVLAESESIDAELLAEIHAASAAPTAPMVERRATPPLHLNLRMTDGRFKTGEEIETEAMHAVLAHFAGNIAHAAEALGMAKSTFYRKLKGA